MSHSRFKDPASPGKFAYTCWNWTGDVFRSESGFASHAEADRAAEQAEREMTLRSMCADDPANSEMTLDEIFNELKD